MILILLVTALFVKKEYVIEREIIINKPIHEVFDYIKYLKNQDNYSVWNNMDPNMEKTYQGIDRRRGFVYKWDSKIDGVGKGEQEIIIMADNEAIYCKLHFIEPFESVAKTYNIT